MADWNNARIAVNIFFVDPNGGTELKQHRMKLPNRVSTKTTFNYKAYGGLTRWNQGVFELPPEFTFTIAVPATSPSVRLLRALHTSGIPFNLDLIDARNSSEFALITEVFIDSRITSKELPITVGELPMLVFQGMALRYSYDDGQAMSAVGGNTPVAQQFGSGKPTTVDLFAEWAPAS